MPSESEAEGLVQQILSGLSVYETDDFTRTGWE